MSKGMTASICIIYFMSIAIEVHGNSDHRYNINPNLRNKSNKGWNTEGRTQKSYKGWQHNKQKTKSAKGWDTNKPKKKTRKTFGSRRKLTRVLIKSISQK